MNYVIAHAPVGSTIVLSFKDGDKKPKEQTLSSDKEKEEFVKELTKDDTLYLCLGGADDRLALAAIVKKCTVMRVPTFRLGNVSQEDHDEAHDEELEKSEGDSEQEETTDDEEVNDEKPEEEDSAVIAKRKARAWQMYEIFRTNPSAYYTTLPGDVQVLILVVLWKSFLLMQKTRIATHLRLLSVYRDLYLVDAAMSDTAVDEDDYLLEKLGKDKSFGTMPPEARLEYLASLKSGDEVLEVVTEREKEIAKMIEKRLKKLPIYTQVFEPIAGMGILTAARMIGSMSDIRRFSSDAHLKSYAGYSHFADGSRQRRRKGHVSNWHQVLKQGVWQFTQRQVKMASGSSEWRDMLDRRRAYELVKILRDANPLYLPTEIAAREPIVSVKAMAVEDLDVMLAAVDGLRGETEMAVKGSKKTIEYMDWLDLKYPVNYALRTRVKEAYLAGIDRSDMTSKKLMKGVKGKALQKACRFLGQRLLRHVFNTWKEFEAGAKKE